MSTGNGDNQQSPTNSVKDAAEELPKAPRWLLSAPVEVDSASVKCSDCGEVTTHTVYRIMPKPNTHNYHEGDDIKMLDLARRLRMCQVCGKTALSK